MRILIAEDSEGIRNSLQELLKDKHEVLLAEDGAVALKILERTSIDVVITDNLMPNVSGLDLIRKGKVLSPSTGFVLMTAFASIEEGLEAIRLGADEYFTKPFQLQEILHRVGRIEELRLWKNEKERKQALRDKERLVGTSPATLSTADFIKKAAASLDSVLLQGLNGTGKKTVARMIHHASPRCVQPLVTLRCASLNPKGLESEIFGTEKNSVPGVTTVEAGKCELANGGTLLLEAIDALPSELQAKLVPVLQRKEFHRIGASLHIKSDARFIATTHSPLKDLVESGTFNEDLFTCLNGLFFEIKPLSERLEDLPFLIENCWEKLAVEWGRRPTLSPEVMECLNTYPYPGNIRELENFLERLMILGATQTVIGLSSLPEELKPRAEKKRKAA
jgi:two-component system, NtrC family, response regulator PilR